MPARLITRGAALSAALASTVLGLRSVEAACNNYRCGSNTPILWGTFVRGLSTTGEANAERVVLRPELIPSGTGTCTGTDIKLTSVDGRLMGMRDKVEVCADAALVGSAFDMDVPYKALTMRVRVRISEIKTVSTWEVEGAVVLPTYRFEVIASGAIAAPGEPPPDGARPFGPVTPSPLCQETPGWMEEWQTDGLVPVPVGPTVGFLRYENPEGTVGQAWQVGTDHALIVSGETYTETGSSAALGPQWFQIACAGSAIAKMRLLGINPWESRAVAGGLTTATLKMLGARYGGDVAFTKPGMAVRWDRWDHRRFYGGPARDLAPGPSEATWTRSGAACVDHLRLMRASLGGRWLTWVEGIALVSLAREYRLRPCPTTARAVWTTTTVDHVAH